MLWSTGSYDSGHKGEHREANTKYDHDDITLQDLSLTPGSNNHKDVKDFNKVNNDVNLWLICIYSQFSSCSETLKLSYQVLNLFSRKI